MRKRDFDRNKFLLEDWPAALESGEFKQGENRLLTDDGAYCCLGVACELLSRFRLLKRKDWTSESELPDAAATLLRITPVGDFYGSKREKSLAEPGISTPNDLAQVNDGGKPFKQIAALIRRKAAQGLFDIKGASDASA